MLKLCFKKFLVIYLFFITHQIVNECETDINLLINNLNFNGPLTFVVVTSGIFLYNYIFIKSTTINSLPIKLNKNLKESEKVPSDVVESSFLSLTEKIDCDLSKKEQMELFLELKKRVELIKQIEIDKKNILDIVEPSISSTEDNFNLFNWIYNLFISIF